MRTLKCTTALLLRRKALVPLLALRFSQNCFHPELARDELLGAGRNYADVASGIIQETYRSVD